MIENLFSKYRTIGVVGNTNQAKTSLVLNELINVKENVDVEIYVFGVSDELHSVLNKNGINIIHNKEDIFDLKIKNSVIYIDEIAQFFDPKTKNKKTDKLKKWINRLYHPENNNYLVCSTAESGYWNKLMCDLIKCWIVKEIDYESLVLRTPLRRKIEGINSLSDYRIELKKSEYYIINEELTQKMTFKYNPETDVKKNNPNPFKDFSDNLNKKPIFSNNIKNEIKSENKNENKCEVVDEFKNEKQNGKNKRNKQNKRNRRKRQKQREKKKLKGIYGNPSIY